MAQTARTASQSWGLRVTAAGQSVIADGSGLSYDPPPRYRGAVGGNAAVVSDVNASLTLSKWAAPPRKVCLTSRPEGRDSPSLQGADP